MSAADSLATTVLELQRKMERAVAAERERCANIAELADISRNPWNAGELIAAAIRSG